MHLSCILLITLRDEVSSPKTGWVRILPSHPSCRSLAQLPTMEKWKCSCWLLDYVPAALRWYKQDLIWTGLVEYGKQSRKSGENRKWLTSVPQEWSHAKRCCEPLFWGLKITFCVQLSNSHCKPFRWETQTNCFLLRMFHPLFQSEKLKIKISEVEIWWVYFEMEMRWLYIHILCVHRHVCINYRKWILIYDRPCLPSDYIYLQMRSMKN